MESDKRETVKMQQAVACLVSAPNRNKNMKLSYNDGCITTDQIEQEQFKGLEIVKQFSDGLRNVPKPVPRKVNWPQQET